jgi:hypothetical protein
MREAQPGAWFQFFKATKKNEGFSEIKDDDFWNFVHPQITQINTDDFLGSLAQKSARSVKICGRCKFSPNS